MEKSKRKKQIVDYFTVMGSKGKSDGKGNERGGTEIPMQDITEASVNTTTVSNDSNNLEQYNKLYITLDINEEKLFPIPFTEFLEYTNILEIVEINLKILNPDELEKNINNLHIVHKMARKFYTLFYTKPNYRKVSPLNNLNILPDCPDHIRKSIMDIPEKYRKHKHKHKHKHKKSKKEHSIKPDELPQTEQKEVCERNINISCPSPSSGILSRVESPSQRLTEPHILKPEEKKSAEDLQYPVSLKLFKKYVNFDDGFEQYLSTLCDGDEHKIERYRRLHIVQEKFQKNFYKQFYESSNTRKTLSWTLRPCPRKIKDAILANGFYTKKNKEDERNKEPHLNDISVPEVVASDVSNAVLQSVETEKSLTSFSGVRRIYNGIHIPLVDNTSEKTFPVTFEELLKYTNLSELAVSDIKKAKQHSYSHFIEDVEYVKKVARKLYTVFYTKPIYRQRSPLKNICVYECPDNIKKKLFNIPETFKKSITEITSDASEEIEEEKNTNTQNSPETVIKDNTLSKSSINQASPIKENSGTINFNKNLTDITRDVLEKIEEKNNANTQKSPKTVMTDNESSINQALENKQNVKYNFPVSYETFKKYTNCNEVVEKILKHIEAEGNEKYVDLKSLHDTVARNFHTAYYIQPSVREKYKVVVKPCPARIKELIMQFAVPIITSPQEECVEKNTIESHKRTSSEIDVTEESTHKKRKITDINDIPSNTNDHTVDTEKYTKTKFVFTDKFLSKYIAIKAKNCSKHMQHLMLEQIQEIVFKNKSSSSARIISNILIKSPKSKSTSLYQRNEQQVTESFFKTVEKCFTLAYVARSSRGIKQHILLTILEMSFHEFLKYTKIHESQNCDPEYLKKCYEFSIVREQTWPVPLYMSVLDLLKYLKTRRIIVPKLDLQFISPKILHYTELATITNFDEIVRLDYFKETSRELGSDFQLLEERRISFYKRCWSHERWIWMVPKLVYNWRTILQDSNKTQDLVEQEFGELLDERDVPSPQFDLEISSTNNCINTDEDDISTEMFQLPKEYETVEQTYDATSSQNTIQEGNQLFGEITNINKRNSEANATPVKRCPATLAPFSSESHVGLTEDSQQNYCLEGSALSNDNKEYQVEQTCTTRLINMTHNEGNAELSDNNLSSSSLPIRYSNLVKTPSKFISTQDNKASASKGGNSLKKRLTSVEEEQPNITDNLVQNTGENRRTVLPLSPNLFVPSSGSTNSQPHSQNVIYDTNSSANFIGSKNRVPNTCNVQDSIAFVEMPNTQMQKEFLHREEELFSDPLTNSNADDIIEQLLNKIIGRNPLPNVSVTSQNSSSINELLQVLKFTEIPNGEANCISTPRNFGQENEELTNESAIQNTNVLLQSNEIMDDRLNYSITQENATNCSQTTFFETTNKSYTNQEDTNIDATLVKKELPNNLQFTLNETDDVEVTLLNEPIIIIDDDNVALDNNDTGNVIKTEPTFLNQLQFSLDDSNGSVVQVHELEPSPVFTINDDDSMANNLIEQLMNPTDQSTVHGSAMTRINSVVTDDDNMIFCEAQRIPSFQQSDTITETPMQNSQPASRAGVNCNSMNCSESSELLFEIQVATIDFDGDISNNSNTQNERKTFDECNNKSNELNQGNTQRLETGSEDGEGNVRNNGSNALDRGEILQNTESVGNTGKNMELSENAISKSNEIIPKTQIKKDPLTTNNKGKLVKKVKKINNKKSDVVPQITHVFRSLPLTTTKATSKKEQFTEKTLSLVVESSQVSKSSINEETSVNANSQVVKSFSASQALATDCTIFDSTGLLRELEKHQLNLTTMNENINSAKSSNTASACTSSSTHQVNQDVILSNKIYKTLIYRNVHEIHYFGAVSEEHVAKYNLCQNAYGQEYMEAVVNSGHTFKLYGGMLKYLFPTFSHNDIRDIIYLLKSMREYHYKISDRSTISSKEDLRERVLFYLFHTAPRFTYCNVKFDCNRREYGTCEKISSLNNQSLKQRPHRSLTKAIKPSILQSMLQLKSKISNK